MRCGLWSCAQELNGIWVRFEHDLHSSPFSSRDKTMLGARSIVCRTLTDWRYRVPWSPADGEFSIDESKISDNALTWYIVECACFYIDCVRSDVTYLC